MNNVMKVFVILIVVLAAYINFTDNKEVDQELLEQSYSKRNNYKEIEVQRDDIEESVPVANNQSSIILDKEFNDVRKGYTIRYPSSWILNKLYEGIVTIGFSKKNGAGIQVRINENWKGNINRNYAERYAAKFKKDLENHYSHYSITILDIEDFAGKKGGYTISYKCDIKSTRWFFKQYLFKPYKGRFFHLQSGVYLKDKDIEEPILDLIADSLQYT